MVYFVRKFVVSGLLAVAYFVLQLLKWKLSSTTMWPEEIVQNIVELLKISEPFQERLFEKQCFPQRNLAF